MSEIITRTKNQIRPRSERIRFNNDAIINMSTDGLTRLLVPQVPLLDFVVDSVFIKTNIVQAYTNIDAAAQMNGSFVNSFSNDSGNFLLGEFAAGGSFPAIMDFTAGGMTGLLNNVGLNVIQIPTQYVAQVAQSATFVLNQVNGFSPQGDWVVEFHNGGSGPLTGGDSANWMEINLYYFLLNASA